MCVGNEREEYLFVAVVAGSRNRRRLWLIFSARPVEKVEKGEKGKKWRVQDARGQKAGRIRV